MRGGRFVVLFLLAVPLSACGTINSWLARNMAEHVPYWAGGLPPDAPPRPGTVEYDEYRKQLEKPEEQAARDKPVVSAPAESRSSQAIY